MNSPSTEELIQLLLDLESAGAGGEALLCRSVAHGGAAADRPFLIVRQDLAYPAFACSGGEARHAAPARLAFLDGLDIPRLLAQAEGLSFCCFRAHYFPEPPRLADDSTVVQRAGAFVVLVAGEEAARAWSARCNAQAAEVLVETCPAWRRRGYARAACAAWACAQFEAGRAAFYNHPVRNVASAALERSLGLVHLLDGAWCYETPGAALQVT